MLDEHCHIIWDVDDGSCSREESLDMLAAAARAGITQIVATPHMRWDDFDNNKVVAHFNELSALALERHGIQMWLGFEVYYKRLLQVGLDAAPRFTTAGTNNLLIEFNSGGEVPEGWQRTFYELQGKYGLDITVAHPERYSSVLANFDLVYRMKDMGCRLQVSASDLFGSRLNAGVKCARRLVSEGLCDALVSDAHCPQHYEDFSQAVAKFF